jgi:hypothetical protein
VQWEEELQFTQFLQFVLLPPPILPSSSLPSSLSFAKFLSFSEYGGGASAPAVWDSEDGRQPMIFMIFNVLGFGHVFTLSTFRGMERTFDSMEWLPMKTQ